MTAASTRRLLAIDGGFIAVCKRPSSQVNKTDGLPGDAIRASSNRPLSPQRKPATAPWEYANAAAEIS